MSTIAQESTRIRPLVAWRALRALFRNGEDTKQVFIIGDALRGRSGQRAFQRFRATELGREVVAGKRSLLSELSDRTRLAALPDGTLGHCYHDFMAEENLTADGLVDASKVSRQGISDEVRMFRDRMRDQHDLHHVTTGYGRDGLGEVCVLAFGYAQSRNRGIGAIALLGMLKIARAMPGQPVRAAVLQAYRNGRAAAPFFQQDWEVLLPEPLEEVRRRLNVQEPSVYRRIVAAVRSGQAEVRVEPPRAMAAE
jgi:ubiquinone biosynthesis protein COQ4